MPLNFVGSVGLRTSMRLSYAAGAIVVCGGALILGAAQAIPENLKSFSAEMLQTYREQQASSVRLPYLGIALMLLVLAVAIALIKLPPR